MHWRQLKKNSIIVILNKMNMMGVTSILYPEGWLGRMRGRHQKKR